MKHIIALVMLFCITSLSAQEFSMDLLKQMQPRNIGPGACREELQPLTLSIAILISCT